MTKEKSENHDKQNENCTSVFKNGILTKEDYTKIWIELISVLERKKCVNFSPNQ
jgi:hypothetical protein